MQTIYPSILTLHILCYTSFVGATVVDFIVFKQFCKFYEHDISKAKAIWVLKKKILPVVKFGGMFAFLTGLGLLVFMHAVYGEQTWMQIKVPLVILAIINITILNIRQRKTIEKDLEANKAFESDRHNKIKTIFSLFYLFEFSLMASIIFLAAFVFTNSGYEKKYFHFFIRIGANACHNFFLQQSATTGK